MIQTVIKRDGRIVGFNEEKIATAIRKAMLHTENGEDRELVRQITDHISFKGDSQMTVEAIQDAVELELMNSSRKDVAQKYIAYRNQRSIARKAKTRDMFLEIINIKSNDITRENANMNADTPAGMMMKFSSETTKPFVDDYLLSEEVKEAVENNYLHIHDKDYYPTKSHMRTTSVGPHPEIRFFSRTWRITPGKAYRNSQYFRLYLARNSPERNAWWSGDPGIRFLSGSLRAQ